MWDFMSLHQKPVDGGERTSEEAALFKLGLGALPIWYGHAETVMWMQPGAARGLWRACMAALGLAETYESSGAGASSSRVCHRASSMLTGGSTWACVPKKRWRLRMAQIL